MEESNGNTHPPTLPACAHNGRPRHTIAQLPHTLNKDGIPCLLVLEGQHQPVIPFSPPLWASHPPRPRLERSLRT